MLARGLLALLFLLASGASVADYGLAGDLPPKDYLSPSAEYSLRVDPSSRGGAGPAHYELKRNDQLVWRRELPFTLWDAVVADDGTVGGYGYSDGFNGRNFDEVGEFIVALLDVAGKVRLDQRTPRVPSQFLHTMADPRAAGLFLDVENDRLVVRVRDADINAGIESWWIYTLSSAEPSIRIRPKDLMLDPAAVRHVIDVRPIPTLPLTLVQWYRMEFAGMASGPRLGTRFTLVNLAGAPVWTLDLADDFTRAGDPASQRRWLEQLREQGSILSTSPAGFEIRHVKHGLRVDYAVSADAAKVEGWKVTEVTRARDDVSAEPAPALAEGTLLQQSLQPLGTVELRSRAQQPVPSIRRLYDFDRDDRGRFGFLRQCDCAAGATVVIVDRSGGLVREIELPNSPESEGRVLHLAWVAGERWVLTTSWHGAGKPSAAAWIDASSGAIEPIAGFAAPMVESLHGSRDGGFVALTARHGDYSIDEGVSAFGADGNVRWQIGSGMDDAESLFSPEDVTVTTDGKVVVLENIRNQLKVFDRSGAFVTALDLAQSWGRAPNYPSGVESDGDGGVIVHDFQGVESMVQMALDGTVRGSFTPRFSDGRRFDIHGNVQSDVDGARWTSDGDALLELGADGEVVRVLGAAPSNQMLSDVAALVIDAKQQIYAADRRTGAVHVFDRSGRSIRICQPDPTDFDGDLSLPSLSVSEQGEVFLSRENEGMPGRPSFLQFDANCGRVGTVSIELDEVAQDWYSQPGSRNRWILGFIRGYLVDADRRVLAKLERTADGQWLDHPGPAGTAPDGSIAIVSGASSASDLDPQTHPPVVTLFDRLGAPLRTWPAPEGLINWAGDVAFDGRQLAFATRSPTATTRPGYPDSVIITNLDGNRLFRFVPPHGKPLTQAFLVPGAQRSELWLFDGAFTIHRYAMP